MPSLFDILPAASLLVEEIARIAGRLDTISRLAEEGVLTKDVAYRALGLVCYQTRDHADTPFFHKIQGIRAWVEALSIKVLHWAGTEEDLNAYIWRQLTGNTRNYQDHLDCLIEEVGITDFPLTGE